MLKLINENRLADLMPPWADIPTKRLAKTLDDLLLFHEQKFDIDLSSYKEKVLPFFIHLDLKDGGKMGEIRIDSPVEGQEDHCGRFTIGPVINQFGSKSAIQLPINDIIYGCSDWKGEHLLYVHTIITETPLSYVGITKQKWHSRWGQHVSESANGSQILFHKALNHHKGIALHHNVIVMGNDFNTVMNLEEMVVEKNMYPAGLNMIPGGFAGMRYLHKLGFQANSLKQRDAALRTLIKIDRINGKPNPLCAARWHSDQDFINRVICGHGDRLSVEQVRQARLFGSFGMSANDIVNKIKAKNLPQVERVLTGRRYARVV